MRHPAELEAEREAELDPDIPRQSHRDTPSVVRPGGVSKARTELSRALQLVVHNHDDRWVTSEQRGQTLITAAAVRPPTARTVSEVLAAVVRCADAVSAAMVPQLAQPTGYRPESLGASRVATVITEAAKLACLPVDVPAPPLPPPITGAIDPDSDLDDWANRDEAAVAFAARMKDNRAKSLAKGKALAGKWDRRRANKRQRRRSGR